MHQVALQSHTSPKPGRSLGKATIGTEIETEIGIKTETGETATRTTPKNVPTAAEQGKMSQNAKRRRRTTRTTKTSP
jgi:hypothetical protein